MGRKKIVVVNIDDNDNKNDEVIGVTEPVEEPIEIPQEVIEKKEKVEETMETPPVEETPIKLPETQTKTRSQELTKCPKCNKMVTSKTLKYSHKNTCSGEEKNKLKKEVKQDEKPLPKQETVRDIEEVPLKPPKLVRQSNIMPEKISITPEIMREHRQQIMRERIQFRQDKMKNLFANSIK